MTRLNLLALLWVVGPIVLQGTVLAVAGRRRQSLTVSILLLAGLATAAIWSLSAARLFWIPGTNPFPEPVTLVLAPGSSTPEVAERLEAEGIVPDAGGLVLAARMTGSDRAIRSGRYRFPGGEGLLGVLGRLLDGGTAEEMVTVPEGLMARRVAGIAARQAELDSAAFMALVTDPDFIQEVLPPFEGEPLPQSLEGYLLPDTYNIYYHMPVRDAVRVMVAQFQSLWEAELGAEARRLGMTRHEVVTLASIIEREAATDAERPTVSAVFHNRLRLGMRLESCATVLFALGRYKPRLYEKDLQVESPYNTYRTMGLPPGPIANAGRSSLRAAVTPSGGEWLYFVARGDGTHTFSRTYREHLRAKQAAGEGVLVGGRATREQGTGGPPVSESASDPPPPRMP